MSHSHRRHGTSLQISPVNEKETTVKINLVFCHVSLFKHDLELEDDGLISRFQPWGWLSTGESGLCKKKLGKSIGLKSADLWKMSEGSSFQIENPPAIELLIKVEQDSDGIALHEMRLKRAEG